MHAHEEMDTDAPLKLKNSVIKQGHKELPTLE